MSCSPPMFKQWNTLIECTDSTPVVNTIAIVVWDVGFRNWRKTKKHIAGPWLNISTMSVLVYSTSVTNKNRAHERKRWESSQVFFFFFPSYDKTSVLSRKRAREISAGTQTLHQLLVWGSGCLTAPAHYTGIKCMYLFRSQKVGESLGKWPCWLKLSETSSWLLFKTADKIPEDLFFNKLLGWTNLSSKLLFLTAVGKLSADKVHSHKNNHWHKALRVRYWRTS